MKTRADALPLNTNPIPVEVDRSDPAHGNGDVHGESESETNEWRDDVFGKGFFASDIFPGYPDEVPFGHLLNGVFFSPIADNLDYPIHGPNVIRFSRALIDDDLRHVKGFLSGRGANQTTVNMYKSFYHRIMAALEVELSRDEAATAKSRIAEQLKVAALYHDIGKFIRRANHPQIGLNLLRNYDEQQRQLLVDKLRYSSEQVDSSAKHNRFALISSITQHHDKFGVASTGEGGLPIFSDILYFTSDVKTIPGIRKNVTSVMLLNMADIAAVNSAPEATKKRSVELANKVAALRIIGRGSNEEADLLAELRALCEEPSSCLGLSADKVTNILHDWWAVLEAIDHCHGNRAELKLHLINLEQNPARAIQRILRLLREAAVTSNAKSLVDPRFVSSTSVESILVGTLGAHQFQSFCEQFATVAKLDYGLAFFKCVICACVRNALGSGEAATIAPAGSLTEQEAQSIQELSDTAKLRVTGKITTLFIRVLEGLVARYSGVLLANQTNPRRFGFQMRDLTKDQRIRESIIDLLCVQDHKDPIALTWIADEVTVWSMD